MPITLRKHQSAAADAVEFALSQGVRRPLVDMCVAAGKSFTYAELARRATLRNERVIIGAHVRELVQQNAKACQELMPDVHVGINAASLDQRIWRAPVICASIQSVYANAATFGPIDKLIVDEAHLLAHSESGMYHRLWSELGKPHLIGGSGTVFRLQGGRLDEGENAPFDRVVYTYSILDGIRDKYLVPPISLEAADVIDPSLLRTRQGEYTGDSQDAQMLKLMDNHIVQMVHHGWHNRQGWLIFEASTKAAHAMHARMNQWGIPTGLVLGTTPDDERARTIQAYRLRKLRALISLNALGTGFDVPHTDLLVMRRRTQSLGFYIQMVGRLLRTIGGNLESSIAAGKSDGAVLDFAGNIDQHGPLDCIEPKSTKASFVECFECGKRNPPGSRTCWACGETLMKNCPACLQPIPRVVLDCPCCGFDLRQAERKQNDSLSQTPSGSALLSSDTKRVQRQGGWVPVRGAWEKDGSFLLDDADGKRWELPSHLGQYAADAKWIRAEPFAILIGNGKARSSAIQVMESGAQIVVPMPAASFSLPKFSHGG